MARLTAPQRGKLPAKVFAGPNRSFPIPDKPHAVAAERLVGRAKKAGSITAPEAATIKTKAAAKIASVDGPSDGMHQMPGKRGHFNYG